MAKTVIVPLDRSVLSESALDPARWLATNLDADIHLITATLAADLARDETYLEATRSRLGIERVSTHVLPLIFPAPGIIEYAAEVPDPLICMTTRGHSGIGAVIFGSVAEMVIRDAPAPIVLVGPNCNPMDLEPGPILVCWDGSPESASILATAVSFAQALGTGATIVTVRGPDAEGYGLEVPADLQSRLDRVAHRFSAANVAVATKVLDRVAPDEAIVEYAASIRASLIFCATHGESGLLHHAIGRVASKIVHDSTCPVVVRRPLESDV